jgi:hypothetical protein
VQCDRARRRLVAVIVLERTSRRPSRRDTPILASIYLAKCNAKLRNREQ